MKSDKKNSYNGNLSCIGKTSTDWKNKGETYEKIHTFQIDFIFVVENYNKNENDDIIEICKKRN